MNLAPRATDATPGVGMLPDPKPAPPPEEPAPDPEPQQPETDVRTDVRRRVVVAGCPRAGKSTRGGELAASLGVEARATDALIETHAWGDDSVEVASWFDAPGPWVVEGVTTVRALRKWLASHPDAAEKPCDEVVLLTEPLIPLTKGQASMKKAIATIWAQVEPALRARGVEIS